MVEISKQLKKTIPEAGGGDGFTEKEDSPGG